MIMGNGQSKEKNNGMGKRIEQSPIALNKKKVNSKENEKKKELCQAKRKGKELCQRKVIKEYAKWNWEAGSVPPTWGYSVGECRVM